jgi:Predicted membrane protein
MTADSRISAIVFGTSAGLILALATLCTRAVAIGASPRWRLPFHLICHGIEKRCLVLWSVPMPICSRCAGIYLGFLGGLFLFLIVPAIRDRVFPTLLLVILVAPLVLDGVSQALGFRESTNDLRMITGVAAGAAFMAWVMTRIEFHAIVRERRLASAASR